MVKPHPHTGATYKIIARLDGSFEIVVSLPGGAAPVTITGMATRADADRWIAQHQEAIAAGSPEPNQK